MFISSGLVKPFLRKSASHQEATEAMCNGPCRSSSCSPCMGYEDVSELLCETEIDDIDLIPTLANPHKEVVRLYVPMDEVV